MIDDANPNVDAFSQTRVFWVSDNDGYGNEYIGLACSLLTSESIQSEDCDDSDPNVHPDNLELTDDAAGVDFIIRGNNGFMGYGLASNDLDQDRLPDNFDCEGRTKHSNDVWRSHAVKVHWAQQGKIEALPTEMNGCFLYSFNQNNHNTKMAADDGSRTHQANLSTRFFGFENRDRHQPCNACH